MSTMLEKNYEGQWNLRQNNPIHHYMWKIFLLSANEDTLRKLTDSEVKKPFNMFKPPSASAPAEAVHGSANSSSAAEAGKGDKSNSFEQKVQHFEQQRSHKGSYSRGKKPEKAKGGGKKASKNSYKTPKWTPNWAANEGSVDGADWPAGDNSYYDDGGKKASNSSYKTPKWTPDWAASDWSVEGADWSVGDSSYDTENWSGDWQFGEGYGEQEGYGEMPWTAFGKPNERQR